MQLARVIRLDDSDANVYAPAADPGEWAIPGAFAFSNWTDADLEDGKAREAFTHGWLGLESFGRASLVAVAPITDFERNQLVERLAEYFLEHFGAPSIEAARPVAEDEIAQMQAMCEDQDPNTMIVVERAMEAVGVREKFRLVAPKSASLEAFAVHGSLDE
jgi:hypothetical protein